MQNAQDKLLEHFTKHVVIFKCIINLNDFTLNDLCNLKKEREKDTVCN